MSVPDFLGIGSSGDGGPDHILELIGDDLLGGQYRVVRLIREGCQASTYLAIDKRNQKQVVVKIVTTADVTSKFRLRDEELMLAQLETPNIIAVESNESDDLRVHGAKGELAYIVLEYIEGENLRSQILTEGPFNLARAIEIVLELIDALSACHDKGIWHRDIKPSNMMLDKEGKLKLIDFGLSRWPGSNRCIVDFEKGNIFGTASYYAPEMFVERYSEAAGDIYGIGMSFYWFLTGCEVHRQPLLFMREKPLEGSLASAFELVKIPVHWIVRRLLKDMMMLDPSKRPSLRKIRGCLKYVLFYLRLTSCIKRMFYKVVRLAIG